MPDDRHRADEAAPPSRPAVFLDRDGVLNRAEVRDGRPFPPPSADALEVLPGVPEACRRLTAAGFVLVVVTNQPDIARGRTTESRVEAINERLRAQVPLDALYLCPHDDADGCDCRKPRPGMLLHAADDLGLDLTRSIMVGDRWQDIEAGRRAGCRTVLIDRSYDERPPEDPDARFSDLTEAVDWIIGAGSTRSRGT